LSCGKKKAKKSGGERGKKYYRITHNTNGNKLFIMLHRLRKEIKAVSWLRRRRVTYYSSAPDKPS